MLKQICALLFLLLLPLSACGPMYDTQYTMVPPRSAEGRMCVMSCQQGQNFCRQSCQMEQQSCRADARERAMMDYRAYVHTQTVERKPIKKSPSDFERSCSTSSCESRCESDHRQCYVDCGGQVIARQVCTFNCDKVPPPQSVRVAPGYAPQAAESLQAPLCQPGQRVEARSDGEWYEAVVKAPLRSNGRCPVHFVGYGDDDDENVLPRNLRPLGSGHDDGDSQDDEDEDDDE
ncbi:hypothetical protein [Azospirillum sp. sgz302134]